MEIIKNNIRYVLALALMLLIFLVSKDFFINNTVTSEDCQGEKCKSVMENSILSNDNPVFFANDMFNSKQGEFYRLSFREKSDQPTKISIKAATALENNMDIQSLGLQKSSAYQYKELVFSTDQNYTDLVFSKDNKNDGANVSLTNVQISKLNIKSKEEFSKLSPTIFGDVDFNLPDQKQDADSSAKFSQLLGKNILLGQVFRPEINYITGVTLDMDVTKPKTGAGGRYELELREVDYDGAVAEVGNVLAQLSFSLGDLDKYRQADGKIRFPIYSPLEKGKYYFIGINGDKGDSNQFSSIVLRGSSSSASYSNGLIAIKNKGKTYTAPGALFFVTYGIKFKEVNGQQLLSNSVIEDIGNGKGLFKYQTKGLTSDIVDLYSHSEDIQFDDDKKIIRGSANSDSNYVYKFNTIYPFSKMIISGKQADATWSKVNISYSYDGENWEAVPFEIKNSIQIFNHEITNTNPADVIYFKITPYYPADNQKKFGLADFKIEADLEVK